MFSVAVFQSHEVYPTTRISPWILEKKIYIYIPWIMNPHESPKNSWIIFRMIRDSWVIFRILHGFFGCFAGRRLGYLGQHCPGGQGYGKAWTAWRGSKNHPKTIGKSSINGGFNSWKINYKWWKTYVYIDVEWSLLTRKLQIILEAIWVFRIILHVYPRVTINT